MRYVYCHPLFDERKCSHRFSYQLSKAFEKNNLQLERFDYQGTGEAEGKFCDVTMDSLQNDVKIKIADSPACLIGTRLGATIAFNCCCQEKQVIKTLILIEPVVNGKEYVEYLFRKQHLKDMITGNHNDLSNDKSFCNLEGYKTSNAFLEQVRHINIFETHNRINVETVYIACISSSGKVYHEYDQLVNHLKKNGIQVNVEIFNLPIFWERIPAMDYSVLTDKIVEWCK